MESALTLSLCLPYKFGGYALPHPKLNAPVHLENRGDLAGGVRWDAQGLPYFECDLVWEQKRLIVEYHGDESHFTREGVAKDARKANLLQASGFSYYAATLETLASPLKFREFAKQIRLAVGKKHQPTVAEYEKRGEELRKTLRKDYLQEAINAESA